MRKILAIPLLTGLLAGCNATPDYPMDRPGTWQPTGANEQNLRAMAVDQDHLRRGVTATTDHGGIGSNAVTRVLTDRRRPLPAIRSDAFGAGDAQQGGGGADAGR
jgi:hypothetical protein